MPPEQLQRQMESTSPQPAQHSRHRAKGRAEDSSEFERSSLAGDSDPVLRLDELEAQVAGITQQLQAGGANGHSYAGPVYEEQRPGTANLLARIEALEERVASYTGGNHSPANVRTSTGISRPDVSSANRDNEEIAQLRFHVATLASQLARAEAMLKEVQGTRVRRWSRTGRSRPIWMFWHRRTHR